jgi:hypothetical protein
MTRVSHLVALAAITVGVAAAAVPAMASDRDARCGDAPKADWLSVAAIAEKATALGYVVRGVEADDGCWEVEARGKDGAELELHFHPVTAQLVHTDRDD